MYVFDNSPFSALFKSFYRRRFPSLWGNFDSLIADGTITSTREVARELDRFSNQACLEWLAGNREIFTTPTAAEAQVVRDIYAVRHFQQNLDTKKLQKGGLNADPFVVAKASASNAAVVTLEQFAPNAARIPNICQNFDVPCLSLEDFMEAEGWEF
jgi:Domain of unknown function (DUF4411)